MIFIFNTFSIFQSVDISRATYSMPWYGYSYNLQKITNILMVRSQKAVRLTAGKFIGLSLETFASVFHSLFFFFLHLFSLFWYFSFFFFRWYPPLPHFSPWFEVWIKTRFIKRRISSKMHHFLLFIRSFAGSLIQWTLYQCF